jgi:hypothetical protein
MTGIPTLGFDYFNLAEIPTFILCNPNKEKLYALGGISERQYRPRFNALSELSFRADEYVDEIYMEYYPYIVNRRVVYVVSIGYFMITEVSESNDGIVKYKEVGCQSLEVELSSRKLTGFVSGSGIWDGETLLSSNPIPETLTNLYNEIKQYMAGWTFDGYIPPNVDGKYRSFDVSDTSVYNLLMTDVEEAYECVFEFDTVSDLILIRDANELTELTDIFISHDNVIKSMSTEEVTDELATCLYVVGGGNLGINWVNPLGDNYIYNFRYFKSTDWMEQSLIDAISTWENKVTSASPSYIMNVEFYNVDNDDYWENYAVWETVSGSARYYKTVHDTLVAAAGGDENAPGAPEALFMYTQLQTQADGLWQELLQINALVNGHYNDIKAIADSLKLDNTDNFTPEQQVMLQPFIIQSSYVNDNIIQLDNMTSASIIAQATSLYNQGAAVLERISAPRYNFEVDSVSFLQIKDFETFSSQLALGKRITVEIRPGVYLQPILLGADIDFDNPENFKLIFGNRLRLNDESFQFNDLLNKALSAGTSINLNSQAFNDWTRAYKNQYQNLASGVNVNMVTPSAGIDVNPQVQIQSDPNTSTINFKSNFLKWNDVDLLITGMGSGGGGGGTGNIQITLFSGGQSIAMYPPTSNGLQSAITQANSGDVIFLPDVDITGNFTIPEGVNLIGISSRQSIIRGIISLGGDDSYLGGVSIIVSQGSPYMLDGIIGPISGTAHLFDVWVRINNTSSGGARGVQIRDGDIVFRDGGCIIQTTFGYGVGLYNTGAGNIYSHNSIYDITSTTGSGYAFVSSGLGNIYVTSGYVEATTAPVGEI